MRRLSSWVGGAACAALLSFTGVAEAELYRCTGPDGRTVFTDNPSGCRGARRHTPRANVQNLPGAPPPPPAAAPPQGPDAAAVQQQVEADQESFWRQKKAHAQAELDALEERHAELREFVGWCNRGGELVQKDESGLKSKVSCDRVRQDYASLDARLDSARAYVAGGLAEECRRAGCLPGWIR